MIAISSHVARGSVGNRAMVFALERLGFTVWAVPTVLLTHHPGHGPTERIVPDDDRFAALLRELVEGRGAAEVAGVVTGYFATAGQARATAGVIRRLKEARPDLLFLCDPVIGDGGGLYVDRELAEAIRDELLPLADAATPNAFECAWLAGADETAKPEIVALARRLPPPVVLVTSAPAAMRGHLGNLLVTKEEMLLFEHPALTAIPKGTGDLLAALLFARRLRGRHWNEAAELAISSVFAIVAGSAKAGAEELLLAELQDEIATPAGAVTMRPLRMEPAGN